MTQTPRKKIAGARKASGSSMLRHHGVRGAAGVPSSGGNSGLIAVLLNGLLGSTPEA